MTNSPGAQLIDFAIKRILELRENRRIKKYLLEDVSFYTTKEQQKYQGLIVCNKCGGTYKVKCGGCAGKANVKKRLSKGSKLSERDNN